MREVAKVGRRCVVYEGENLIEVRCEMCGFVAIFSAGVGLDVLAAAARRHEGEAHGEDVKKKRS